MKYLVALLSIASLGAYDGYHPESAFNIPKPSSNPFRERNSTYIRHHDGTTTQIQYHGEHSGVIRYQNGSCDYFHY